MKYILFFLVSMSLTVSCKNAGNKHAQVHTRGGGEDTDLTDLVYPQEKHLKNVKQLTFGGDNAEAYWSFDNSKLVFQIFP